MSEEYSEVSPSFTTADTMGPVRMSFSADRLEVEFEVYGTPTQRIVFHDVRAFSWAGWEDTATAISPDRIGRFTSLTRLRGDASIQP